MGPTRPSVENGGQIELRGEARRALIRRIRNDESPTEAAWDLDDGGGLARVTCHGHVICQVRVVRKVVMILCKLVWCETMVNVILCQSSSSWDEVALCDV